MVRIFLFSLLSSLLIFVSDAFPCGGQFMPPNMQQNGMGGYGSIGGGGCPYQQSSAAPYGRVMGPNSGPAMSMSPGFPGAYGGQFSQGPGASGQYPGFAGQTSAGNGVGQSNDNIRCFRVMPDGQLIPIDQNSAADLLAADKVRQDEEIVRQSEECLARARAAEIMLKAEKDAGIIKRDAEKRAEGVMVAKGDISAQVQVAPTVPVPAPAANSNVTKDGVQIITVP